MWFTLITKGSRARWKTLSPKVLRSWLPALGLVLVTGLVSTVTWHGPYLHDDIRQIQLNPNLQQVSDWTKVVRNGQREARVLQNVSFALNWVMADGATWPFKVSNTLLHLLAGGLWALLMIALRADRWLAWTSVALFLLHPLQMSTPAYIMGRISLLQALVYLGALVVYARAKNPMLAALICLAGMVTKESCLLVPGVLFAWDYFMRTTIRWRALGVCTAASALGVIPLVVRGLADHSSTTGFGLYPVGRYLFTQIQYWGLWPVLLVDPSRQSFIHPYLDTITGTSQVLAAVGLVFIAALIWLIVRGRRWPDVAVALVLAVVWMLPTNSVLQMINPFAEYRLYLASACLMYAVLRGLQHVVPARWLGVGSAAVGLYVVAWSALQLSLVNDPVALYRVSHQQYPQSHEISALYASALEKTGDLEAAERMFALAATQTETAHRKSGRPLFRLAQLRLQAQDYAGALQALDKIPIDNVHPAVRPGYYEIRLRAHAGANDRAGFEAAYKRAPASVQHLTWDTLVSPTAP